MRRSVTIGRDQQLSAFGATLARLCESTSARGAALVDAEGETVDYAGIDDPFDIKVTAAEWRIVLDTVTSSRFPRFGPTRSLVVRAKTASFAVIPVTEGYAVTLRLPAHSFRVSHFALAQAIRELCAEGGLELPGYLSRETWVAVDIQPEQTDARRPHAIRLANEWHQTEVLGLYTPPELVEKEIGYRARLESGAEFNLVRERLGRWFADGAPLA